MLRSVSWSLASDGAGADLPQPRTPSPVRTNLHSKHFIKYAGWRAPSFPNASLAFSPARTGRAQVHSLRKNVGIGGGDLERARLEPRRASFSGTYGTAWKPCPFKTPTRELFRSLFSRARSRQRSMASAAEAWLAASSSTDPSTHKDEPLRYHPFHVRIFSRANLRISVGGGRGSLFILGARPDSA